MLKEKKVMLGKDPLERSFKFLMVLSAGVFAPLCMFSTPSLVILLTLLALNGFAALFAREEFLSPFKNKSFYFGMALITFAFISSFWAPELKESLSGALKVLILFIMAFVSFEASKKVVIEKAAQQTLIALTLGVFFSSFLLILDHRSDLTFLHFFKGPEALKHQYNQIAVLLSILSVPLTVYWFKREKPGIALLIILLSGCAVYLMQSDAAKIALLMALIGGFLGMCFKRLSKHLLMGVLMVGFLSAPFLTQTLIAPETVKKYAGIAIQKFSFYHRLYIWNFVGQNVFKKPLLGWGMNASRSTLFSGRKTSFDIPSTGSGGEPTTAHFENVELLPLHPHNVALQLWLELGFVGILLGIAFLFSFIIRTAPTLDSLLANRFSYYGSLTAALTVYLVSYGMWQSWWLALLGLVSIYAMLSLRNEEVVPLSVSSELR